jgi:hypothetical protein
MGVLLVFAQGSQESKQARKIVLRMGDNIPDRSPAGVL